MLKTQNLFLLMIFISAFRKRSEPAKHATNAAAMSTENVISDASSMNAPRISGTDKRNENFAAFSFGTPEKSPAEIVIPLREIPGKIARI